FIGLDPVMRTRAAELGQLSAGLINLDAEIFVLVGGRLRQLWQAAQRDFYRLLENCPKQHRGLFVASRRVLQTLLVRAYLYREFYERIFDQNRSLGAVITHNDFTTCSYLACKAAKDAGATSFTLQHGFPTQEYFPTSADNYLVWGRRFRDFMVSRSGVRSKLVVAGAPRFDVLGKARTSRAAAHLKREEGGMSHVGRCDVVFLSQSQSPLYTDNEHRSVLAALKPLLDDHRFNMVVRLHPQESERRFRRLSGFDRITIAPPDLSLQETLSSADLAISCNSTAMLEAMAIGVPVVQIAPEQLQDRLNIMETCAMARDGNELMQCLETLLTEVRRNIFIERQNELLHGYLSNFPAATDAVCDAIEQEVGSSLATLEAGA
ncbi:MAG: hypothetical protein WA738_15250, partial [Candidatus Angelobacter sp.]